MPSDTQQMTTNSGVQVTIVKNGANFDVTVVSGANNANGSFTQAEMEELAAIAKVAAE